MCVSTYVGRLTPACLSPPLGAERAAAHMLLVCRVGAFALSDACRLPARMLPGARWPRYDVSTLRQLLLPERIPRGVPWVPKDTLPKSGPFHTLRGNGDGNATLGSRIK
jgi:hypothetical protein